MISSKSCVGYTLDKQSGIKTVVMLVPGFDGGSANGGLMVASYDQTGRMDSISKFKYSTGIIDAPDFEGSLYIFGDVKTIVRVYTHEKSAVQALREMLSWRQEGSLVLFNPGIRTMVAAQMTSREYKEFIKIAHNAQELA